MALRPGQCGGRRQRHCHRFRQVCVRRQGYFAGTQGAGTVLASSGTSHSTSTNVDVDFGTSPVAGTATHVVLWDASTGGNAWMLFELEAPLAIGIGDPVSFEAGSIAFTLGLAGGMSDYLANKLIDLLFRAQAYAWPASLYAALYTSATTAAGGGTGGRSSNNATLTYPAPTGDWGTATHGGLRDAATLGNLMWHRALGSPKTISAGAAAPRHNADTLAITWA